MEAIRKIQTVKDGQVLVELPKKFWGKQVEIIVLPSPQSDSPLKAKKSLRGCLNHYANPSLLDHENKAWQKAYTQIF